MTRDELAAAAFPARWAAAQGPGERQRKRRHNLRRLAEGAVKLQELRTTGASCATCRSFGKHPDFGRICEANSDFHGYALAKADGLCTDWSRRP